MKKTKKYFAPLFALALILNIFLLASCAKENTDKSNFKASAQQKTMQIYTNINLTFDKPEAEEYQCSVSANERKYIKVDSNNEGNAYWLSVDSNKATPEYEKPIITVYKDNSGKKEIIKEFQITVSPLKEVEMQDVEINKGETQEIMLINPYELKEYNLKYDKKKINIQQVLFDGEKCYYNLTGLKKGKTKVKAYLDKTDELIGSFTVVVGDFSASIKDEYKDIKLSFNEHMNSKFLENGFIDIGSIIKNYDSKARYTVESDNPDLTDSIENEPTQTRAKSVIIYTKKTGSANISVFENKEKIGEFRLTVKRAKDSEVFNSNMMMDNDGIFYEFFISPGDKADLKTIIEKRYINTENSHFEKNEYSFTFKSKNPETVSVDENGICTCNAIGSNKIIYKTKFKDGSEIKQSGSFDTVEAE
ncbi:MAG: hypothetical protein IKI34_06525 [Eubacterium sp.]|nr:hypothetical protein [Eubacterium sp.]